MSKKFYAADKTKMLNEIVGNIFMYIVTLEGQLKKLRDDASLDPADKVRQVNIYTHILTILNDISHPAHEYSKSIYDERFFSVIERLVSQQKSAFESKIVDPCKCEDCNSRGYAHEQWNAASAQELDMEGVANVVKRAIDPRENNTTH